MPTERCLIEDRLLAAGHEHGAALSEQRQLDELAFERPVEIPLVVVLMLEVPHQLAGIGIGATVESV